MYKLFGYIFLFLLTATVSLGQEAGKPLPGAVLNSISGKGPGICGTDILLNRLRRDAEFKAAEQNMNRQVLDFQRPLEDDSIIIVPVVFHIISENPTGITDQLMLDGLRDLNDAFSKKGIYALSKGADTKIRFCLAKKDPDGGTTSGITRTKSFFSGFLNPAIEDARLKRLIQWDPHRYINIWYIAGMNIENFADFVCGEWERDYMKAYATLPPSGGALDGIVVAEFGNSIIHEMGHYLGLYHTFEGMKCINNDCKTDGDMVCDTPPEASIANSSCTNPENSCNTDTLSNFSDGNFTTNVPDQVTNFMDYGNYACHNEFTQGQADRMAAVIKTQRAGLLENECDKPCNDNILANFTRSNPYPLPGDVVSFTNTSTGAASYQWLLDGAIVSTAKNFTYTFPDTGRYKISLKASNSVTCFAVYSDFVTVTCGVTARFYADKRTIASKLPLYPDSIYFANTSENASSYKWLLSNNNGAEQVVSTAKDLVYIFPTPAVYSLRLVASNGTCIDTTELFDVTVLDPTPDGVASMSFVDCYEQTKVRITFSVCNAGYAPIPSGIPVSFYDANPQAGNAHKLGNTFFLPDSIPGKCCSPSYVYIVDVQHAGLNNLYMVFNDSGNTMPLVLPNTSFMESNYANNINFQTNFSFKTGIVPAQVTLEPGDTIQLLGQAGPGAIASYTWSTSKNLSCTNCSSPYLIADSDRVKRLIATSVYGCVDTAFTDIKVPPANDYTISLNEVQCAAGNKLRVNFTLRNSFKRGILPKGLKVSFYEGDPAADTGRLLSPLFSVPASFLGKEADFNTLIENSRPGRLYAVVNDNGISVPVQLPNNPLLLEKDYSNNKADILYESETVQIQPQDTTVLKRSSYAITVSSTIYNPASINWFNGNGYTLSCNRCASPVVTVADSGLVTMQMENKYGCLIPGSSAIKVISPDMTIRITETKCYSNSTTLVKFSICMNNNYDHVLADIPVAFYDAPPSNTGAKLLSPVFFTTAVQAGSCYTYQHIISTPATKKLYAVVNDNGSGGRAYNETNYDNNGSDSSITEFTVRINPADTSIAREGIVQLIPVVSGGTLSSFLWKDDPTLSCLNCLTPIAKPPYTREYALVAQNEYACTDTAYAIVKTFTGGLINIPSAFSPNNDGLNDIFYVLGGADIKMVKDFRVFNRWGEKVFQMNEVLPNDPRYGWDGMHGGNPAAPGTYVYVIKTAAANGKQQLFKGTIILLR